MKTVLPATIWLTGLSASGKSTMASRLEQDLIARGVTNAVLLDGESVRDQIKNYNYSTNDRNAVGIQKAMLALDYNKKGKLVIITGIAHHRQTRDRIRRFFEHYCEVYLKCSAQACSERDIKGHYKKAFAGEYDNFVGVTEPYQESDNVELILNTDQMSIEECSRILFDCVWKFVSNYKSESEKNDEEDSEIKGIV